MEQSMTNSWYQRALQRVQCIGLNANDPPQIRLNKSLMVSGLLLVMIATLSWGGAYVILGEPLEGWISISYCFFSLICLFFVRRFFYQVLYLQLTLGLLLPFFHTLLLGGFQASSGVIIWSLISPLGALFFLRLRRAVPWIFAFPALLVLASLLHPFFPQSNSLSPTVVNTFFVLNVSAVSAIVLVILAYFINQKEKAYDLLAIEQEKAENLLLNILPEEIAAILKSGVHVIAELVFGGQYSVCRSSRLYPPDGANGAGGDGEFAQPDFLLLRLPGGTLRRGENPHDRG